MYTLRTLFERDLSIAKSSFKALKNLTPKNPPSAELAEIFSPSLTPLAAALPDSPLFMIFTLPCLFFDGLNFK